MLRIEVDGDLPIDMKFHFVNAALAFIDKDWQAAMDHLNTLHLMAFKLQRAEMDMRKH